MLNLLETILEPYIKFIIKEECLSLSIDDFDLRLRLINTKCLARKWDNLRCNPNLRCNREGRFNKLCLQHYKERPLKFNLISEEPPEELLRIYRIRNKNVDNEIVLEKSEIKLFEKKVKDKTMIIIKETAMNNKNSFRYVYNNLEKVIEENNYKIDKEFLIQKFNENYSFKNEQIEALEKKITELVDKHQPKKTSFKVKFNGIKTQQEVKTKEVKKEKEIEEEEEEHEYIDIEKSEKAKKLTREYIEFQKGLNINLDEIDLEYANEVKIINMEYFIKLVCYEYEILGKIYLLTENKKIIGEKDIWVNDDLPEEYLNNENQVLHPETCLPIEEYKIYDFSVMFHNITPKVYREYKWNDICNELQRTNEIILERY